MQYKDYGEVKVLGWIATNRGGLSHIEVQLPAIGPFKASQNTFWVRSGDLTPGAPVC